MQEKNVCGCECCVRMRNPINERVNLTEKMSAGAHVSASNFAKWGRE